MFPEDLFFRSDFEVVMEDDAIAQGLVSRRSELLLLGYWDAALCSLRNLACTAVVQLKR